MKIRRNDFLFEFRGGVSLGDPRLEKALEDNPKLAKGLAAVDRNKDRVLSGSELRRAFAFIDTHDHDRKSWSFDATGKAGMLYAAMKAGARKPPDFGSSVARSAKAIAAKQGAAYGIPGSPTSPNPRISHNRQPGKTALRWLNRQYKCNQFVGDALYAAGVEMPSHKPKGAAGHHYVGAGRLYTYRRHFDHVRDLKHVRPGDVVEVDFVPGAAHCAVVTSFDAKNKRMAAVGARTGGARERGDWTTWLRTLRYDRKQGCWIGRTGAGVELRVRFLRPKKALPKPATKAQGAP